MKLKTGNFNIVSINDNFRKWFGEPNINPVELYDTNRDEKSTCLFKKDLFFKELPRDMNNKEIQKELNPSEITLDELVGEFLKMDKDKLYLAFISDANDVRRAVGVGWYGDGWEVGALSVTGPGRWRAGGRVFSRNSFRESNEDHQEFMEKASENVLVPREWLERLVKLRKEAVDSFPISVPQFDSVISHLLGYIESAEILIK